jgi:hypothetical protein
MGFHVEPNALRAYAGQLGAEASSADQSDEYMNKYATFGWHQRGLINQLRPAHERFVGEVTGALVHLTELLERSRTELNGAAEYYEQTDADAAGKADNSYPVAPRPPVGEQR